MSWDEVADAEERAWTGADGPVPELPECLAAHCPPSMYEECQWPRCSPEAYAELQFEHELASDYRPLP